MSCLGGSLLHCSRRAAPSPRTQWRLPAPTAAPAAGAGRARAARRRTPPPAACRVSSSPALGRRDPAAASGPGGAPRARPWRAGPGSGNAGLAAGLALPGAPLPGRTPGRGVAGGAGWPVLPALGPGPGRAAALGSPPGRGRARRPERRCPRETRVPAPRGGPRGAGGGGAQLGRAPLRACPAAPCRAASRRARRAPREPARPCPPRRRARRCRGARGCPERSPRRRGDPRGGTKAAGRGLLQPATAWRPLRCPRRPRAAAPRGRLCGPGRSPAAAELRSPGLRQDGPRPSVAVCVILSR